MRQSIRHLVLLSCWCIGLFHVTAQTANWTAYKSAFFPVNSSGQINGISRVSQLKFHPTNSQKMYAVSARGGLFISANAGATWSAAPGCDNLVNGTRFASVCIDPLNDQVIYLGGGDHNYYSSGSGVWKSTNGGNTFTPTTLTGKIVVELILDPLNNNILVAATNTGIYKSMDAGSTWTLKTTAITFDDMKKKENATSRVLFASTRDAQLYISNDFGETWSQLTTGIYIPTGYSVGGGTRIGLTPADSNYVYFFMNAKGGTLFRSTNGGTSFTAMKDNLSPFLTGYTNSSADPGQGDYNTGLGVDRTNRNIVYFVAHNVWKSTDGGGTWTQLTVWYDKVHTDMHQVTVSPYNTSQLWNMNDGGVWLSTDGGNTWSPKSDGLYGYEIYHGSCSPTRRDMMSIGTQDNGELYGNTTTWYTNRGGDWQSHGVFDYRSNSSMVYYFLPDWGTVQLPQRRLVTGSAAAYGLPVSVTDFSDITFHRSNTNLAFVGDTVVWRTTNLSATTPTWTSIFNTNVKIMKMHVHFADPNRLYIITADQKIHFSINALSTAPTFTTVVLPNATSTESHITTIKTNLNTVYITTNSKVYRSADNGATWSNITYNLPATNHMEIIADEYYSATELVFVATGGSVYYKTANATSWTLYSTDLPSRTSIVDMSIYNDSTSNTLLRVFTYGRGVWETPITNLRSISPNFSADNTMPCPGGAVNFSDLSTGNVTTRFWSFPGGIPSTSTATNPVVTYASPGIYSVSLTVGDGTTSSSITQSNYINVFGRPLNVAEGFETGTFPPNYWNSIDGGLDAKAWAQYTGAGGFNRTTNSMFYDNYSMDAGGVYDEFRSTNIDLNAYTAVKLKFDVAYQPYSLTSYVDSFQVLVSTNCGATFTSLYLKFGNALNTTGTIGTTEFVPTATQWRTDSIDLTSFIGNNIQLAFRNIGHYGNNLYVDNISVEGTVVPNAGTDRDVCAGTTTTLGSSSITGLNYSWSPSSSLSNAFISNPVATPAVTTTYFVTATNPISGLSGIDTVVVTVNPNPIVAIGFVSPICSNGSAVTLAGSPVGGIFTGSGVSGNQFSPSIGTGSYVIAYSVTTTNGCSASATTTAVVNAAPTGVAITPVSPRCSNTTAVTLSGTPTGGVFSGTGVTGNQFNPIVGAGNFIVTYTYTNSNSCSASASTTIQVNAVTVSATVTAPTCNAALNGSIDITPATGSGNYSYLWSNGSTAQDLNNLTAGNYSVTVTDVTSGCTASGTYTLTQPAAITISGFTPTSGASASTVIITGSNFTGVTDVRVNNVSIGATNYVVNSTTQITLTVTSTMTSGQITVVAGACSVTSSNTFTKVGLNFSLRLLIQGYYIGSNLMRPVLLNQGVAGATTSVSDTVKIELYSNATPPVLVASKSVVLTQAGTASISFSTTPVGSYWIAVSHRNAIQTWSSSPQSMNTTSFTYNFTSAANKAYGNNMVELATGVWGFYSGDVPVKDAQISLSDLSTLQTMYSGIVTGYNAYDLNGDGILESADYSLLENNVSLGIQVVKP